MVELNGSDYSWCLDNSNSILVTESEVEFGRKVSCFGHVCRRRVFVVNVSISWILKFQKKISSFIEYMFEY